MPDLSLHEQLVENLRRDVEAAKETWRENEAWRIRYFASTPVMTPEGAERLEQVGQSKQTYERLKEELLAAELQLAQSR